MMNLSSSFEKSTITYFLLLLMITLGCKKEIQLNPQERITLQLTSAQAWETPIVTVDGVDYTEHFADFSIQFGQNTYTTISGAPIWKANGTWIFTDETATKLLLDGGTEVEINSIDNDFLELSIQWDEDTFEPGRIKSVKGKHKFKFKKQKKK